MSESAEQQFRCARDLLESMLADGTERPTESLLEEHSLLTADESLTVELIYNEYLIREELGERPQLDEFVERFPNYSARIRRMFSIHATLRGEETSLGSSSESVTVSRRLGPGDIVGPFELLSTLGSGGRGFVFKARQVELDRIVALKILRSNAINSLEIRRFLSEARSAAILQHSNIVTVYESDIYENLPYIALEYVSCGTLNDYFPHGPVNCTKSASLIAVLSEAIHYAHEKGVIHRDIKPSNILMTEEGTPKIADFGLAKRLRDSQTHAPESMTQTGALLGTPSYMAPEQAEGRNDEVGVSTDVYGLGTVLYQLITGQVPFVGESTLDVLQSIRERDPISPRLLNPKVPKDLETICLKCLEKHPSSRYPNAAELANDLNRFLSGYSITARPSGVARRISKIAARHPVTSALSVALVLAVLAVIGVISWQWKQAALGERTQAELRNAAEAMLYSQQLALAQKEIKSSESQRALQILDQAEPARRNWEWQYLKQSCQAHQTMATVGPDTRRCVVSPDGALLAVARGRWGTDQPGSIAVLDTRSRKLLFQHESSFGPLMDVAFSPDSEHIVTVSNRFKQGGGEVSFYHSRSGEREQVVPITYTGLYGVAYHPTQPRIALACANRRVEIWDSHIKTPIHRLQGHRGTCFRVAFSPCGKQLASCSRDGTVRLWDAETGVPEGVLRARRELRSIAYTPDGRYVVANGRDHALQLWDRIESPPRHAQVHLAGDAPLSHNLSIAPNGRYATAIGDGGRTLYRYDLWVQRVNVIAMETSRRPFWIAHHPDSERLYFVDSDGTVLESNPRHTNPLTRFVAANAAELVFNDKSDCIAVAAGSTRELPSLRDYSCRMLNLSDASAEFRTYRGASTWSSAIAISPDGANLASGCDDGRILQWQSDTEELVGKTKTNRGEIVCLTYNTDGTNLLSVGSEGWLTEWRDRSSQASELQLTTSKISAAAMNAGRNRLSVFTEGNQLALYDITAVGTNRSKQPASAVWRVEKSDGQVYSLAMSSNTQQIAILDQQGLELWQTHSAAKNPTWSVPMTLTSAADVAFHPDDSRVALVDGWVGRVYLFDAASGHKVLELNTRSGTDRANICFSHDGNKLAATLGGELYIWSISDPGLAMTEGSAVAMSKLECRNDFQWHVNQSSAQIYAGRPFGAEFHARRAVVMLDEHFDKLQGMKILDVLRINAKCHLAKALIALQQNEEGERLLEALVAECATNTDFSHALSLLLTTYPGEPILPTPQILSLANHALESDREDSNRWAVAGIAHYLHGNEAEARQHLEHAKAMTTVWKSLILFPLAVVEAKSGNDEAAVRLYNEGVEWMESSAPSQTILRRLRRWAGREISP